MNSKQIYDLLTSIDKGHKATEKELSELASVKKIRWKTIESLPSCMRLLTGLQDLDLSFTDVKDISALACLTTLSSLDLTNTAVKTIRPLANLISLTSLALYNTNVENIRPLAGLTSLQFLNLYNTFIEDIRPLANLASLKYLDLSSTRIKDIHPLSGLTSLQYLYLGDTHVKDLTPLSSLSSIRTLDLNNTDLLDLHPISILKNIQVLNLCGSKAPFIPENILYIGLDFKFGPVAGHGIFITGLELTRQDVSIFGHPRELILEYYNTLKKEEEIPVNKCKVVFLGDGGAGKSLIINRLLNGGEISPDFDGKTTPGIDINSKAYVIEKDWFELSFWDFGGEAIMHSMHRMFLTNRTLYVVVTNAREANVSERSWYWIQNIKSFANGSPIFLLVNHRDENQFVDINMNGLQREYPEIKAFRIVSALNDSINEFNTNIRDQILQIIQSMESVHAPFPKSWLTLMNYLQEMEDNRITSDDFYNKCRERGIKINNQLSESIIKWYQDLGVCFYSKDHYESRKYMVLKPKWLLNALYILIFNGRKYAANGIISEHNIYELINEDVSTADIQIVYTDIEYKEEDIAYILQVLMNFNLIRRLDNNNIFVPMLCDENEPEGIKESIRDETLHYTFNYTFLPENLLYRLMIHQWHAMNLEKVWRTGAVFEQEKKGWKALVQTHENCLDIFIESENPKEYPAVQYMDILCEATRSISKELGLNADEYVVFQEKGVIDRFKRSILEGSKKAGIHKLYSDVFERTLKIDDILGKTIQSQDLMTEGVISQMLSSLSEMSEQIVFMKEKSEVELTSDFQRSIESVLNLKYGIQIAREYTMGLSKKTLGETDLYFFREDKGEKEHLYVLENKIIRKFKAQYKQLIGYLNPYFRAGITLSINKEMEWEDAFDFIYEKLEEFQEEGDKFATVTIDRKTGTNGTRYIRSEHIVPETGYTMPVYHLVMQLSDKHRHDIAIKARS